MRAMAEKDCRDDIMFLCKLRGRTMNSDTAINSSTRKPKVTLNKQHHDISAFWKIYAASSEEPKLISNL